MIYEYINRICRSQIEEKLFSDMLYVLSQKLDAETTDWAREKFLTDLIRYLERKPSRRSAHSGDELDYLRNIRNLLAHRRNVPTDEVEPAIPIFWHVLVEVADQFQWDELSRLLTYALHLPAPLPTKNYASSKTRIKKYEQWFNGIPWDQRFFMFRNLLLTIFETPEFQHYLKDAKTKNHSY